MAPLPPRQQKAKTERAVRFRSGAFTLIEILVVVAIIAVLAAIAFPFVGRAIDTANNAKCISNLRQMNVGLASYLQDKNGFLPNSPNVFVTSLWPFSYPDRPLPSISGASLPPSLKGTIFECPAARRDGSTRSYGFNMYIGNGIASQPKKLIALDRPLSKVCLIADSADNSTLTPSRINDRHNGFCNVLFADGHVAPTTITPEIRQSNYSDVFWGRYLP